MKKTLPVGISDYIRAQSEYYYVDKTLLIKEFLDRKAFVSLFTRPRRFGKTLNMDKIVESLFSQDTKKLQDGIGEYLKKSISFYDAGAEGFYHGLVLGLIALMDNQYRIRSNRESGDGRYDISLFPRENKYPGMIMELKWDKDLNDEELDALSAEALDQINDKGYDTEMCEEGVTQIIKFGIAFSGKRVKIRTE